MSNVDEQAPFQLFPALDSATEAALAASIERFGVLVPVVVDQNGQCLDGHHRRRIADKLGVKYRVDVVQVAGDEEGREIARTLNSDRRHLDVEQRREVVAALAQQTTLVNGEEVGTHSPNAIADALGVALDTVQKDMAQLTGSGKLPARRLGKDGKVRATTRPTVVAAKNQKEADRAQQALTTAPDAMPESKVLDVKRAERIAREAEAERVREAAKGAPPENIAAGTVDLRFGDFRDTLGDLAGQVDAIITDPPYPGEFVPLFDHLGSLAAQLLKPTGVLVCMTGQYHLPAYIEHLSSHLTYRWTCAYLVTGQRNRNHGARVGTGWKPLLIFQPPDVPEPPFLLDDVFASSGDDKAHHHWGQSESGMAQIVERFSNPGDLVVDPFLGGGTTGVVCRDLGRRFAGSEIDAVAFDRASERLR